MVCKVFHNYREDITDLRHKILFRIKELMNEGIAGHPKKIVLGKSDSLHVSTFNESKAKVCDIHYRFGENKVTLLLVFKNGDYADTNDGQLTLESLMEVYDYVYQNFQITKV